MFLFIPDWKKYSSCITKFENSSYSSACRLYDFLIWFGLVRVSSLMHHTSDDLEKVSKGMDSISLPVGTDDVGETIAKQQIRGG